MRISVPCALGRAAFIWFVLGTAGVSSAIAVACARDDRTITVNASVTPTEGALPANLVVVMSGSERVFAAKLDEQGHAAVTGPFPSDATEVFIEVPAAMPGGVFLRVCDLSMQDMNKAASEANLRFSLPGVRRVPLVEGQNEYSVSFTLKPAISITGQVTDASGTPIKKYNLNRANDKHAVGHFAMSSGFVARGIERGQATWLFFSIFNETQVRILPVPAAQTAADLDIGTIALTRLSLVSAL